MRTSKDLYGLLGLPKEATREDIRRAHRRLAREYHPDANTGDDSAEERFKEVQHAYEVLSDPRQRREYNERLVHSSHLKRKLVEFCTERTLQLWKACVSALALILIIDGFLFYRYKQTLNSRPEHPTIAFTQQRLPSPSSAEVQVEENDPHPEAMDHEQQDGSSYVRETEPVAATKDPSPSLHWSTASANHPAPVTAEEGLTSLPTTSDTTADYYNYSPDHLYEDGYYLPDYLYEDGYYLPDYLYEDDYYLPDYFYVEEVDHE